MIMTMAKANTYLSSMAPATRLQNKFLKNVATFLVAISMQSLPSLAKDRNTDDMDWMDSC